MTRVALLLRWAWSEVAYLAASLGYVIRPYDMLADRRRWWWQPRTRCGFSRRIVLEDER